MSSLNSFAHPPEPPQPGTRRPLHRFFRIAGWSLLGLACVAIASAALFLAAINFDGVHHYLLRLADREASSKLGVPVEVENFAVHLSNLSLDVYGIRVAGAAPRPNPPLLEVDRVAVGVRIVSIIHRQWYLDSLRIDHPVAWVTVDERGVSNLPKLKSSGDGNVNAFTLGIRHALLDRGEMYYNSRPSDIAADLHNLFLHGTFNSRLQMYSADLSYTDGRLKYRAYQPFANNLYVKFNVTPTVFNLIQARLSSGASQALLSGEVRNYSTNPVAQVKYAIALDGSQIASLLNDPSLPAGMVNTSGSIGYRGRPGRPLLETITLVGDLSSSRLALATAKARAEISNLAAHYSLANGNATLSYLRAAAFGGELTAQGTMNNLAGATRSHFNAALRGISLAALRHAVASSASAQGVGISGALNATADASWGKTLSNLVAKVDLTVNGELTNTAAAQGVRLIKTAGTPASAAGIPANGAIHAVYSNRNHALQLANSYVRTSQTNLEFNGTVGKNSSLAVHLQAKDLSELAAMVNAFRPPAAGAAPLDLAGMASFQGAVQGSTVAPQISGQFAAQNLRVNQTSLKIFRAAINAGPSGVSIRQGQLQAAPQGEIAFNASAGLNNWKFSKSSPLQIDLEVSRVQLAQLAQLSGKPMQFTGSLNANVHVHGSASNPEGSGSVELTKLTAYSQPIQSAKVNFSAAGDQVKADLLVHLLSGDLKADVSVEPRQKTYTAQVTSSGIQIGRLQLLQARGVTTSGVLALNASGQGSFSDPQLNAAIQVPSLTVGQQTISGLKLEMALAHHVANASVDSTAINTRIQAKATVDLTGNYETQASLDTSVIQMQPLLAVYSPADASSFSGQTEIHATLQGPLKQKKLLQAHVTIPVLKVAYGPVQLAATSPIQGSYTNQVFNLQPATIRGTDTDLQLQASIPLADKSAPMSLRVQGSVGLLIAQLVDPTLRSSGQVRLNIDSHGSMTQRNLGGEIDIVNASFTPADLPIGLQDANGVLKLSTNRLEIASFQGTIGGGTVTASGGVDYRPNLVFDMGVAAKGIRILYPQGLRENVDANLHLSGTTTNALLGGTVDLANITFTPGFDLTGLIGNFSSGVEAPPSQGFAQNLKLNVAVHSSNNINLASRTLSVQGSANIQARGTAAEPVILGNVSLTGGDVILNGDRFVLTGGTIRFVNPTRTEPVLNVTVTTSIQQYNIDLTFRGPVDQMHSTYTSDPALPQADIIHLLAFGQTTEAAANNPTPANQEAESLVASQVSSQVTSRIAKVAGISQLSINPVLSGNSEQGPPGADITIQQRVTGNLFVTFTTNVATTQDQTIQGEYQVSPRVSISATRDPNGGFGLDTLIKKTW